MKKPNIIFVFADQWRKQATGYNGDVNVKTPNLDKLSKESINLTNAISGCPICSPYRASLLTGQYPLTHGLFTNDVPLNPSTLGIGDAFKAEGYNTAYVGKWHVDGHGRNSFIPKNRRKGFDYWKVLECTHEYTNSSYYDGECEEIKSWYGYDAIAQTKDVCNYIENYDDDKPFILILSWGPPHNQNSAPPIQDDWYFGAPKKYREIYNDENIQLPPNVLKTELDASQKLSGYYAHCSVLDDCIGDLLKSINEKEIEEDTIFVFTSDHGDMVSSHGQGCKQTPWEESICVPFLLRYPRKYGKNSYKSDILIDAPDIMPTLLGLANIAIPDSVEGQNLSEKLLDKSNDSDAVLIACYVPVAHYEELGGREYRGVRTNRYTYTRHLDEASLLFDNEKDQFQMNNLINNAEYADLQQELDCLLTSKLKERNDEFLSREAYMKKWGYHHLQFYSYS